MKKIFAIVLISMLVISAVSCNNTNNDGDKSSDGTKVEVPAENGSANKEYDFVDAPNAGMLKAATAEEFTDLIGYSMLPYNQKIAEGKGMIEAITGYNGRVELTYHSFTDAESAAVYFDETIKKCPGEQLFLEEAESIESCKKQDGTDAYMIVRIDNTILFGWGKGSFDELNNWFYALGYAEKNK